MKENIFIYAIAAALTMSACSKDNTDPGSGGVPDSAAQIELFATRPSMAPAKGSRVIITGNDVVWGPGDRIGVFTADSKVPTSFLLSSGANTTSGTFAGKIDKSAEELYVVYPYAGPFADEEILPTAVKIWFNGQTQNGFGDNAEMHLWEYAYMASAPVSLVDGKGTLNLTNLAVKMSFEFSLPEAATVRFLTMSTAAAKLYDKGAVDLTAAAPVAAPWGAPSRTLSMGFRNGAVAANQKVVAHMMMLPADLSSTAVTFYISAEKADGTPVTYTMTKPTALKFEASSSYVAEVTSLSAYDTYLPMVYVPGGSLNICGLTIEGKTDADIIAADYKVNSFWIAQTQVTNQQYCDFLNERKPGDAQLGAWLAINAYYQVDTEVLQIEKVGSTWKPKSGPILQADKTTTVGSYANYPMIYVTYLGANAYSNWLAEKKCGYTTPSMNNMGYYLPSEAQWEYAATGSEWNPRWNSDLWAGSDDPSQVMWYNLNCDTEGSSCLGMYIGNGTNPDAIMPSGSKTGGTHPVAKLKANYLGAYDMSGNVTEWCRDWFHVAAFPYGANSLDPWCSNMDAADIFNGEQCRSGRGGFWSGKSTAGMTPYRDFMPPTYFSFILGFRPILPLK